MRLLGWSLRHRRWRHAINVITVIITSSVVMMFVSVMVGLVSFVRDSASSNDQLMRMLVYPKTVTTEMPEALAPLLSGIDGVKVVQRFRGLGGRHESGAVYFLIGEEATGLELNTEFFPVEPAVNDAWKQERTGAVVAEQIARELRLSVGQVVDLPTAAGPLRIKVVGLSYNAPLAGRIAVHYEYLTEFVKNPGTCFFRLFSKPEDFERIAHAVDEQTRSSAMPIQVVSQASRSADLARAAGMIPAILGFLGIFLVVVTGLTLANTYSISVRERRTEMATLRVLGFRSGALIRTQLFEAMLVGFTGGVCALALCYVLFRGGIDLTPSGGGNLLPPVTLGIAGIVSGLVASMVVPLIGALPSTLASARMPLVHALRDSA